MWLKRLNGGSPLDSKLTRRPGALDDTKQLKRFIDS
jgi:hypothetical protein